MHARRAKAARAAGFDGTADEALERAAAAGREIDAARQAEPGTWRNQAHP